jgi:hypothetical protein
MDIHAFQQLIEQRYGKRDRERGTQGMPMT